MKYSRLHKGMEDPMMSLRLLVIMECITLQMRR